jgi:hypothetical protein
MPNAAAYIELISVDFEYCTTDWKYLVSVSMMSYANNRKREPVVLKLWHYATLLEIFHDIISINKLSFQIPVFIAHIHFWITQYRHGLVVSFEPVLEVDCDIMSCSKW